MPLFLPPLLIAAALAVADDAGACKEDAEVRLWVSPVEPVAGGPLRVMAVAEGAFDGEITIAGQTVASVRRGGPPFSLSAALDSAPAGVARVTVTRAGAVISCKRVNVARRKASASAAAGGLAWASRREWDRATENLFSAWIEQLFDAPVEASLSFRPLEQALRDPARNFLWNHRGFGEDDAKGARPLPAAPDCADLPYFSRAYFAWKLGLPFSMRDCSRGTATSPPVCGEVITNEVPVEAPDALGAFKKFLRQLANKVHSGSARTALDSDATDHYPVALSRASLRPGTVYADPYGHVLMVVGFVAQADGRGGLLLAVDGQPDATVARKRFWEGTFLFASDSKSAGPGFKAFRPLVRGAEGLRPLSNRELAADARFASFSDAQARLSPEAFYARLGAIINPKGLPPENAYEETLAALLEQVTTRVGSVDNGEAYMKKTRNAVVPMPEGPKIFETMGPWEDYSTPSRDMRLIIAMNVLDGLPERIVKHPELFVLRGRKPEDVAAEIAKLHTRRTAETAFEYTRSDGSKQRLTIADLLQRRRALEMAYNPNDCAEERWGAAAGGPEHATCQRHAPADQRAKMESYRLWFREAKRPPR